MLHLLVFIKLGSHPALDKQRMNICGLDNDFCMLFICRKVKYGRRRDEVDRDVGEVVRHAFAKSFL